MSAPRLPFVSATGHPLIDGYLKDVGEPIAEAASALLKLNESRERSLAFTALCEALLWTNQAALSDSQESRILTPQGPRLS